MRFLYAIFTAVTLFLGAKALLAVYGHNCFDRQVEARSVEWSVVELAPSKYILSVKYAYEAVGNVYVGQQILKKNNFTSKECAKAHQEALSQRQWMVWVSRKSPEICNIQKLFPFKLCIQALLALLAQVYFLILTASSLKRMQIN